MPKTRVLVVEDSLTVRKRMLEVLATDPNVEVVGQAGDGRTAIELCRRLRPDVVTLDMMLPVMSGPRGHRIYHGAFSDAAFSSSRPRSIEARCSRRTTHSPRARST